MKQCNKCGKEKEFSQTGKCCIDCKQKYDENYRLKNKEKIKEQKRLRYQRDKEKIKQKRKIVRQTPHQKFMKYKATAKDRGISWFLTEEEFLSFWKKDCLYCGDEIKTIGLDRKNSDIGYKVNNVVPCCEICNRIKMSMDFGTFKKQILDISEKIKC